MAFIQNNWLLILVFVLSGAMLVWPLMCSAVCRRRTDVGNSRGDAPHQLVERGAPRRARDQGIRGRPAAERDPHSLCRSSRAAATSSPVTRGRPVVAYCMTGNRSRMANAALARLGFKEVYNLRGGYRAWKDAGLPGGEVMCRR